MVVRGRRREEGVQHSVVEDEETYVTGEANSMMMKNSVKVEERRKKWVGVEVMKVEVKVKNKEMESKGVVGGKEESNTSTLPCPSPC